MHLAARNSSTRKNRNFVCCIESPVLLKKYYSSYGLE